jgi:hypothetical protein
MSWLGHPVNRRVLLFLLTVSTLFFWIGCSTETPLPGNGTETFEQSPATGVPSRIPLGLSRENPMNGLETISLKNWDVRVLDIVRGPEAWERIHEANQFNNPPPDGWSYVLIQYHLQRKGTHETENTLGLHLTGNANILHYSFNNSVVPPDPVLDNYLIGGETSQGWEAYLIREDEGDLMLVLDDLSDYEEPEHFARLAENASLTVPESLDAIEATIAGGEANDPVPYGQLATSENWQIVVQQVERGNEAQARVQEVNRFNEPPAAGQMYLLVKVWVRYIGSDSAGAMISSSDFNVVNDENEFLGTASVSGLELHFSFIKLYPGGEYEGWLAFLVNSSDASLVLSFNPGYFEDGNHRYLSLQQSGR